MMKKLKIFTLFFPLILFLNSCGTQKDLTKEHSNNFQLMTNEKIIKSGPANFQKGIEQVGGKIYLTNDRLVFESHKLNVQTGTSQIKLEKISSVKKSWTKFLGFIPLAPNSIKINTKEGEKFRFVLYGRKKWISAINEIK
jgi:hypothetical protein